MTQASTNQPSNLVKASDSDLGTGAMFDAIAERYDLLNRILSGGVDIRWRNTMVDSLKLEAKTNPKAVDLATGTGDVALAIAKRWPLSNIVGIDPSVNMLKYGREKIVKLDLSERVELREGIAEKLPLGDNEVDAITIAFGIRNVKNRALGLREMNRITKKGGVIAILELSEPPKTLMGSLARIHVHHIVPFLGSLLSGKSEYRYLQKSIAAFPSPDDFCQMMRDAGMKNVRATRFTFGVCHLYLGEASDTQNGAEATGTNG